MSGEYERGAALLDMLGSLNAQDIRLEVQRLRAIEKWAIGSLNLGYAVGDTVKIAYVDQSRTLDPQTMNLHATVARVLDEFGADLERSGARVAVNVPEISLMTDREGLAVVLRNLVGNALKFAQPGQPPQVEVGARREGDRHLVWVRDQGVGFDMKYHDRIFGIFQRLQRAEDYPGTGVGLALVAKAMQRMGGRVWAESEPGQGATFFLEFPS